jgi:hypothetical protein
MRRCGHVLGVRVIRLYEIPSNPRGRASYNREGYLVRQGRVGAPTCECRYTVIR